MSFINSIVSTIWPQIITLAEDAGIGAPPLRDTPPVVFTGETVGSAFCVSSESDQDWTLAAREILLGRCNVDESRVDQVTPEEMGNVLRLIQEAHEAHAQSYYSNVDMSRPDRANLDEWGVYFDYFRLGNFYRDNIASEPCYGSLIFVPLPATPICEAAGLVEAPQSLALPVPTPVVPTPVEPTPAPPEPEQPDAPPVDAGEPVDAGPTIPSLRSQLRSEIRDSETLISRLNFAGGSFTDRAQQLRAMVVQARNYLHSDDREALQQQVGRLRGARRSAQHALNTAADRRNQ